MNPQQNGKQGDPERLFWLKSRMIHLRLPDSSLPKRVSTLKKCLNPRKGKWEWFPRVAQCQNRPWKEKSACQVQHGYSLPAEEYSRICFAITYHGAPSNATPIIVFVTTDTPANTEEPLLWYSLDWFVPFGMNRTYESLDSLSPGYVWRQVGVRSSQFSSIGGDFTPLRFGEILGGELDTEVSFSCRWRWKRRP